VQNPLTSLHEASSAARRAIAAQPGPTVLVGHSFSGMIVTEVGVDPKVTALVYVAARAPDAGEDYTALGVGDIAQEANIGNRISRAEKNASCFDRVADVLDLREAQRR
jgi:predicted alpha/beta hydrolase family esterase